MCRFGVRRPTGWFGADGEGAGGWAQDFRPTMLKMLIADGYRRRAGTETPGWHSSHRGRWLSACFARSLLTLVCANSSIRPVRTARSRSSTSLSISRKVALGCSSRQPVVAVNSRSVNSRIRSGTSLSNFVSFSVTDANCPIAYSPAQNFESHPHYTVQTVYTHILR